LIGYLVSTVVVLGVSRLQTGHWIAAAPKQGRLWFAIVGVCNGLAVFLMYAALARGPVALVSPLVATYPLVTVAASALLLGRLQNAVQIVAGVVLTVAGVGLLLAGAL
jgi:drug/metabolite transporter (DMT)-like permease